MKKSMLAGLAVATSLVAAPALTQAMELSANFSLVSNYKFRGIDQSDNKPAIQGGFDLDLGNGFYLGNWNSSIGFTNSGIEMDLYGGYAGELGNGIGYDVGILQYLYPSAGDLKTTELYAGVSYGPFGLMYSHTVSKRWFGVNDGRGAGYINFSYEQELMPSLTMTASVGYSRFTSEMKTVDGFVNYYDYSLGAAYDVGNGFSLGAAVVGANKRSFWGDDGKARLILSISKEM